MSSQYTQYHILAFTVINDSSFIFQDVSLNLVCVPLQRHFSWYECEGGTQLMAQLVQSSRMRLWVTILHNDTECRWGCSWATNGGKSEKNAVTTGKCKVSDCDPDQMKAAVSVHIIKTELRDVYLIWLRAQAVCSAGTDQSLCSTRAIWEQSGPARSGLRLSVYAMYVHYSNTVRLV